MPPLKRGDGSDATRRAIGAANFHPLSVPALTPNGAAAAAPLGVTKSSAMTTRVNYRKLAFDAYDPLCAHCGFGIPAVLEVAHIDGQRTNNDIGNLVILCPNCHKMLDLDLISNETIIQMRDRPKIVTWSKRMKDAGQKAALTRKRSAAAKKAVATRKRNQSEQS